MLNVVGVVDVIFVDFAKGQIIKCFTLLARQRDSGKTGQTGENCKNDLFVFSFRCPVS